jgi:hypothetical protein
MPRFYVCLAVLLSTLGASISALAQPPLVAVTAGAQGANRGISVNDAGFYIDLPAVSLERLIQQVRAYRASLAHREQQLARYVDEHGLDAKDTLITVILPGGLLYAAIRTENLRQAKAELTEVGDDMEALARDLLAMQAAAGDLTVAQLQ